LTVSTKDAPISPENKRIARHVAGVFGGTARVDEYTNTSESLAVGILSCRDRPGDGVTSYSTIKLSDHSMKSSAGEFPIRLELAGLCMNTAELFPNVLASAAFTIMQSDAVYHPGTVMPNLVRQHYPASSLPHLFLTGPFLWEPELEMLDCGTRKVSWLLAMPISESEYAYLKENGDEALERLFEKQEIDFSNPDRPSAV
jgi:antitoxin YqcF